MPAATAMYNGTRARRKASQASAVTAYPATNATNPKRAVSHGTAAAMAASTINATPWRGSKPFC